MSDWPDPSELRAGLVLFLNKQMLIGDPTVQSTDQHAEFKSRTMICIAIEGDYSWWTPTSTTAASQKFLRRPLERRWRSGGYPQWTSEDQYVLDGASVYGGPSASICRAAHAERTSRSNRALLSAEGLASVVAEVQMQSHRRMVPLGRRIPGIDIG